MAGSRTRSEESVSRRRLFAGICICLAATCAGLSGAAAQAWWVGTDGKPEVKDGIPVPSIASSLPSNGDPGGSRKWLGEHGILYGLEYTNDVLSNISRGLRTVTIDQGKLEGIVTTDSGNLKGSD